jgi:hypothetical protein
MVEVVCQVKSSFKQGKLTGDPVWWGLQRMRMMNKFHLDGQGSTSNMKRYLAYKTQTVFQRRSRAH